MGTVRADTVTVFRIGSKSAHAGGVDGRQPSHAPSALPPCLDRYAGFPGHRPPGAPATALSLAPGKPEPIPKPEGCPGTGTASARQPKPAVFLRGRSRKEIPQHPVAPQGPEVPGRSHLQTRSPRWDKPRRMPHSRRTARHPRALGRPEAGWLPAGRHPRTPRSRNRLPPAPEPRFSTSSGDLPQAAEEVVQFFLEAADLFLQRGQIVLGLCRRRCFPCDLGIPS